MNKDIDTHRIPTATDIHMTSCHPGEPKMATFKKSEYTD
jgi:hypothetical protein